MIKKLAESTGGVKDECLLDFLSFINLNPTKNNLQRYLRAASLEQRIKNSFSEKKLTFEQLVMLSEIEKEPDRSDIFNCFLKNFRFNNNETRDLIKDVLIISGREGVKISELYERICRNREKDLNKNELRKEIKRLCYPTLTDTENRFAKTADSLKLSGSTNILTHPYFESNELEIRIKFTEKEQLAGELEILSENINKGKIDKLLKIVKEGKES